MENGTQNNENLSEQEKMDSLVAELAGDTDVSDNDSAGSKDKDNLKADPVEEIPQDKTDNTKKENLSEQEKMDSLVAELAGDTDVSDNDSAGSKDKDNLKADPVEEIPQDKTDNTEKENLSEQKKMDSLVAELAGDTDALDNDDFSSLDDDEIESFNSDNLNEQQNSIKIDVKENIIEDIPQNKDQKEIENLSEQENKNNKTEENDDKLTVSIKKDNIEKKSNSSIKKKKINKYKKQILLKKYTKPLVLLFLLLLFFSSLWLVYKDKSESESEKNYSLTHEQPLPITNTVKQHEPPLPEKIKEPFFEKPAFEEKNINPSQLDVFIENLDIIIDKLKATQNDLDVFLRYYNDGIKNLEETIITEIKTKNIKTFQDAIKNMRIKLGIETIQRRLFYIDKFQKPFNQLNCDIEELIFLKRKIKIAINIIPIVSEQEIENFERSIKTILLKHISVTDKLFTDNNSINKLESIESIWSALPCSVGEKKTEKKITSEEIWKELSDGNFTNINNLTRLSPAAAECLSKWKGKDLYLNNITKLTPQITKKIIKWKGDWLCLNGLSAISPEVAKILFSWDGKRISLNGIKKISEKEAEYISRWNGKQLEIINLKYFSPTVAEYLTKWLKRGGNIYIDDKFK